MNGKTLRKVDILIFACCYRITILRKDIIYGEVNKDIQPKPTA